MKKVCYLLSGAMFTLLSLSACSDDDVNSGGKQSGGKVSQKELCGDLGGWTVKTRSDFAQPLVLNAKEQEAIRKSNAFSNKFLMEVVNDCRKNGKSGENVMVSPISLQLCLGMAMNGLSDSNFSTLRKKMGFGDLDKSEFNYLFKKISASLNSNLDSTSFFETNNSMWFDNKYPIYADYVESIKDIYSASAACLDFSNKKEIVDSVNAWAKEATRGMIPEVVKESTLPPNLYAILANASYFKADWKYKFEETSFWQFNDEKGQPVMSDMAMMGEVETADLEYVKTKEYQAVRLPYGNGTFCMDVVLPALGNSTDKVLSSIDWSNLNLSKDRDAILQLRMVKFKSENSVELSKVLKNLGCSSLFETMKNISSGDLRLLKITHDTKIEVDNEGTKAAAVTTGFLLEKCPGVEIKYEPMIVDRPFVYAIREAKSGAILFMGVVNTPDEYVRFER